MESWVLLSRSAVCTGSVWSSLPPAARRLPGTRPCIACWHPAATARIPCWVSGVSEVSSGCGNAVRADPKLCLFGLCLVGVSLWLCF